MSKFVKVMPRMLWPLFPGHGVYGGYYAQQSLLMAFICSTDP